MSVEIINIFFGYTSFTHHSSMALGQFINIRMECDYMKIIDSAEISSELAGYSCPSAPVMFQCLED
jgi:hypothetical protein